MRSKKYRTDPLTYYSAGLGWARISSMLMIRDVYAFYFRRRWFEIPLSRWRPHTEYTVAYLHDGRWVQPADVQSEYEREREGA